MRRVVRTTEEERAARSRQMAQVRAKDTKPELEVRRALHRAGLRFRLHAADLPGRPDIVFRSRRLVVNVQGCFWHRHPDPACRLARLPKSRLDFWLPKLDANRERDVRNKHLLETAGWRVIEMWECSINEGTIERLVAEVRVSALGKRR